MIKHVLEVDSIISDLGGKLLLSDVYLKCQTGEIVGMLGRNGCGKSTLLKIIFGTQRAENKCVKINNKLYNQPFSQGNLIAYLPQHNFLPVSITIRNIISIFIPIKENRKLVLQNHRIEKHLDKKILELSGGESRYFQILLLLHLEAKFFLLDEPFSGIEPLYKEEIKQLIKSFKDRKGFILTDHDYRNIIDCSDSIRLIVNGTCKHIKSLNELETWNYVPAGTFGEGNS